MVGPKQPHLFFTRAHTQHTQQWPRTALICTRIWWLKWTVASVDCRMTPVRSPSASSASHPSINRRRSAAAAAETDATEVAAAAAASCRFATRRSVAQRCACGIARCPQCVHAPSYPCGLRTLRTAEYCRVLKRSTDALTTVATRSEHPRTHPPARSPRPARARAAAQRRRARARQHAQARAASRSPAAVWNSPRLRSAEAR